MSNLRCSIENCLYMEGIEPTNIVVDAVEVYFVRLQEKGIHPLEVEKSLSIIIDKAVKLREEWLERINNFTRKIPYAVAPKRHQTVDLKINGKVAKVDKGIAPLISLLNLLGCTTQYCCQGNEHEESCYHPYISFTISGFIQFLRLVYEKREELKQAPNCQQLMGDFQNRGINIDYCDNTDVEELCDLISRNWDFAFTCGASACLRFSPRQLRKFQEKMFKLFWKEE